MSEPIYRLTYTSRIDQDERRGRSVDIDVIIGQARENNAALGLTGALYFDGEEFAQVLEGERVHLEEIYERISCDFRHKTIRLLEFARVDERRFGDWAMALVGPIKATRLDGSNLGQMSNCEASRVLMGGLEAALRPEPALASLIRPMIHAAD